MSNTIEPLDLLANKGDWKPSFLSNVYIPAIAAVSGFGLGAFINWGFRKPPFSGIQKHITYAIIATALGIYFDRKALEHTARRDAVLRHYVELHPEDFPPIERKKFGDVLEMWVPIR